ncbi:alkaline phosphatase family protein [Mucilaginibacter daejeonensis]|uniref:alkaline phosphatase family protein n=1 Tax=Mucilaginibacter daejeonensis TaxID=398049 RepID=UPI001D171275|nr:ectonucleotide pyrophosphatase/phosphodiesterase [Mucilaginibacter daejeonensis]UEG52221.1 alkaline phosphatase family protein [Mucilaginibacter daejeonensis]
MLYSSLAFAQAPDTTQQIVSGRVNSPEQQKKPYVILISVDGMRWDYAKKYGAKHLLDLAATGVRAESMVPSYPSVTFPNHYTLVTGLYPSHHGIVGNKFYDRKFKESYTTKGKTVLDGKWYGGNPLWVLAEQQKMLTASFYWVGSEAPINGMLPTYYYKYNEKIPIHSRIQAVVNWLKLPAAARPHLITFYFPEVDHAGHNFGPGSEQAKRSVLFIDSAVNELNKAVKATKLPVSFVIVADHGMTEVYTDKALPIPALDTAKFKILSEGEIAHIYAKDTTAVPATYEALKKSATNYRVFLRTNTPLAWHYSKATDRYDRIADILLIPDQHYVFASSGHKINPGAHGYDPDAVKDMHASFYAWGPAIKQHMVIPSFKNVEVYPIVTRILGLRSSTPVDGKGTIAKKILK